MSEFGRGPALFDEQGNVFMASKARATKDAPPAAMPRSSEAAAAGRPILIDTEGEPGGRIDHGWETLTKTSAVPIRTDTSSLAWLSIAVALLLFGVGAIDSVGYIHLQFTKAASLGWLSLSVICSAALAFGFGCYKEVTGLHAVKAVEAWKMAFDENTSDVKTAKAAALHWLRSLEKRGVDNSISRARVEKAISTEGIVSALSLSVLVKLDREADAAVKAAAMQTATMTAVSPKASIDSALFILRGVRLIREIALIYGMRPGILGTFALLRRVLCGAATVAAVDFAAGIAMQALVSNALAQKLGGDMAAAAAAWQRMFRLGQTAISACRIMPREPAHEGQ